MSYSDDEDDYYEYDYDYDEDEGPVGEAVSAPYLQRNGSTNALLYETFDQH